METIFKHMLLRCYDKFSSKAKHTTTGVKTTSSNCWHHPKRSSVIYNLISFISKRLFRGNDHCIKNGSIDLTIYISVVPPAPGGMRTANSIAKKCTMPACIIVRSFQKF